MPIISSFYGILIKMYFGDHSPPHFHAEYAEFKAQIAIADFRLMQGSLPPKAMSLVIEWACLHQIELEKNWKLLSEENSGTFNKIEPLK